MERIVSKKFLDELNQKGIGYMTCKHGDYNTYLARPSNNQYLVMTDYCNDKLVLCSVIG